MKHKRESYTANFAVRMKKARAFHKLIQDSWENTAEGNIEKEHWLTKPSGKGGRADVFVDVESDYIVITEVKYTIWDRKSESSIKRTIQRHICQLHTYLESSDLDYGDFERLDKTLSIIYPQKPKNDKLTKKIEKSFEDYGISVVWQDESADEHRARA